MSPEALPGISPSCDPTSKAALIFSSPLPPTISLLYTPTISIAITITASVKYRILIASDILSYCIMKGYLALSLLPLLASASPVLVDTIHNEAAPIISSTQSQGIPDSYIVVFKDGLSHSSASAHHDWVQNQHLNVEASKRDLLKRSQLPFTTFGGLKHTYNIAGGLLGYSGHFDESVIEQVRRHPDVSITPEASLISYLSARDLTDLSS